MTKIDYAPMDAHSEAARAYFKQHWLGDTMIVSSGEYRFDDLNGVVALNGPDLVGLITYSVHGNAMEIVSLNSTLPNNGIGRALMLAAEARAQTSGLTKMVVTVTNDNLAAMRFYQHLGYRYARVIRGAVDIARQLKPTVATIGHDDIPMHDELLMSKDLPLNH